MKKGSARQFQIIDDGDLRKYRIELPNLIDDAALDPYELRLYVHLKRVAGDTGYCYQGARRIATHCRMSLGKVVAAKQALADRGLIRVTHGDPKTSTPDTIEIVNIWEENFRHFRTMAPVHVANTPYPSYEHPVHEPAPTPSLYEQPRSSPERKKQQGEEETQKERTASRERARAGTSPAKGPAGAEACDEGFLRELQESVPYCELDVRRIFAKMDVWCDLHGKQATRARLLNWLNREDRPTGKRGEEDARDGREQGIGPRTAIILGHDYSVFSK